MKKAGYKKKIIAACEQAGTYRPFFDEPINQLAEIMELRETAMKQIKKAGIKKVLEKHKDGKIWLHTADIGYMDEDGQIFIKDRIKNIFARRGFNVHPNAVADFISSLPIVEKAFVMGINHPDEQTVPVAFVKSKEEITVLVKDYLPDTSDISAETTAKQLSDEYLHCN